MLIELYYKTPPPIKAHMSLSISD